MNYLRGAVNAISAPYQYYKELPPINPSTLTGAIDVIVIQRPSDNGDTELACTPFHVRFGKWQVLRPSEKKVNVSVNGHPIPFNMKIGEAGEAFFVFETDDDVPEDLITSPILQPTRPEEDEDGKAPEVQVDRFGAQRDPEEQQELVLDDGQRVHTKNEDELRTEDVGAHEPEFLDLDAMPSAQQAEDEDKKHANTTPKQTPAALPTRKPPSRVSTPQPRISLPSPPPSREHSRTRNPTEIQDSIADEALQYARHHVKAPEVEYHHDIALDAEGYHAHELDPSVSEFKFPQKGRSRTRSPTSSEDRDISYNQSLHQASMSLPNAPLPFRATSEPPPDMDDHESHPPESSTSRLKIAPLQPMQEYSWEWGAFPQPSPMNTTFGKFSRTGDGGWGPKSKGSHLPELRLYSDEDHEEHENDIRLGKDLESDQQAFMRSKSVPPSLEASPKTSLKNLTSRSVKEYEDYEEEGRIRGARNEERSREDEWSTVFGAGGKLSAKKGVPTQFVLNIEGKKVDFELSLVAQQGEDEGRGRKNRDGKSGGVLLGAQDEVDAADLFQKGVIDFERFLDDEQIISDPRLVIRWSGDQYITRNDGSPLMSALVHWRQGALVNRRSIPISRPESPTSEDEQPSSAVSTASLAQTESKSDIEEEESQELPSVTGKKPTSSSWVQWWSRSRRKDTEAKGKGDRPGLRGAASAPLTSETPRIPNETLPKSLSYKNVQPIVNGVASLQLEEQVSPPRTKRYAKTLRLTSDQLKALSLKPGANTITFSLSTSGVAAATARIFVWDSTDLVVVSDIDGTITKSDGLGHVFAMIGRDWTHLGVAKLYTDITRNGYKIMYLTSRAIGQADATRDYLKGIKQNDYQLPEGPVIMSPDRLMASLHREVIMRKPEVFKMACLRDIRRLFGDSARNPFYAGFGNRITDALSYRSVDVPSARIFTIDSAGEVKMELLELAGYKSSYIHMTDLVDQMFPPIHRKWTPEFTDFNYWKAPLQDFPLPDLSPPSPALSARSDTSNQSTLARLRNFSLVGSRQISNVKTSTAPAMAAAENGDLYRSTHLRQMSSFEKLSTTLGFMSTVNSLRRSVSPESHSSLSIARDDSDDEDGSIDANGLRRRERRRSMTSMPGSLDDMHFEMDDDEEEEEEHEGHEEYIGGGHGGEDEAAAEEAFDEDLLAAGEMQNVPFL